MMAIGIGFGEWDKPEDPFDDYAAPPVDHARLRATLEKTVGAMGRAAAETIKREVLAVMREGLAR